MEESKEKYYNKLTSRLAVTSRLADPLTSPNTYWCILNNKKNLAYLLFFMKTNSSQTSKKKLNYLTIFCQLMLPFQ